jgi:hypothetical protein
MALVIFGIIGYPLTQSGSEVWFNEKFKSEGRKVIFIIISHCHPLMNSRLCFVNIQLLKV